MPTSHGYISVRGVQRLGCFLMMVAAATSDGCATQPCIGPGCDRAAETRAQPLLLVADVDRAHVERTDWDRTDWDRADLDRTDLDQAVEALPRAARAPKNHAAVERTPPDRGAAVGLPEPFTRIVSWNVQGRFPEASRDASARWNADIVLLNDQKKLGDHETWVKEQSAAFDWYGDDYSIAAFGPELELMQPLTHPDFRAPVVHLRWRHGLDEFHLFTLHAQTPLGAPDRHWKFLREADLLVDAIGRVSGHWHTIIAGDFNSRSPLDGETQYIHSVTRLLNAGYVDTFATLHPGQFEATKLHGNNTGHRIDYVFISDDLRPALVGAGIDTATTYPENSDHRPVWADLDLNRLVKPTSGS